MPHREWELVQMWAEFMLAQGRSETTIREYRYALLRLASETTPPKALTDITEQDIVVFFARLSKRASARQLYLRAYRSFFGWAAARGHIEVDPSAAIRPKAPTERDPDAFSPEEVAALMVAAKGYRHGTRDSLAIQLCFALGLRRSELCNIRPDDIDWAGERVYVRPSKGDKDRWIEANALALQALEGLKPYWNGTVVGSMHPQWFTMIVHRAATQAGFPPGRRNAHKLRAAFATALLGEGAPVSVVSKLLGHSNLTTTARYLAVRNADKKEAVARLRLPGGGEDGPSEDVVRSHGGRASVAGEAPVV